MIVKICGIKEEETLRCCEKNNVNFFGMIFYSNSPRNIMLSRAIKLQKLSKNFNINGVGVFVDEKIDKIKSITLDLNLKYVQLHGNENFSYIQSLKELGINVIKKIAIRNKSDLDHIKKFMNADFFIFDYKPKKNELPGGNAKAFDWNIIENLQIDKPWFLSGGINLDNIELIKQKINPFGVDLSSGVEKDLGIKDNKIINNLMVRINNA